MAVVTRKNSYKCYLYKQHHIYCNYCHVVLGFDDSDVFETSRWGFTDQLIICPVCKRNNKVLDYQYRAKMRGLKTACGNSNSQTITYFDNIYRKFGSMGAKRWDENFLESTQRILIGRGRMTMKGIRESYQRTTGRKFCYGKREKI